MCHMENGICGSGGSGGLCVRNWRGNEKVSTLTAVEGLARRRAARAVRAS